MDQMTRSPKRSGHDIVTRIIQHVVNRDGRRSSLSDHPMTSTGSIPSIFSDPEYFLHAFGGANDTGSNKFGFQKIMLVCDFIYPNDLPPPVWSGSRFNGYIDKFFSTRRLSFRQ